MTIDEVSRLKPGDPVYAPSPQYQVYKVLWVSDICTNESGPYAMIEVEWYETPSGSEPERKTRLIRNDHLDINYHFIDGNWE